ncbi:Pycsar system effector family protein [Cytophaga aurantiaca]|uniref:Pycsar system effector family protein n=1 Tax=Cytophaga aurantiaca TaxID=29530 RepID=UPI0003724104|nr:Pycsar system effector family protein [Cytophaga aurantiaca]
MHEESLIHKAEKYVRKLYADTDKELYYHNLEHTEHAVKAAAEIAAHYKLHGEDLAVVLVAAWLHDVGYLISGRENHEEASIKIAKEFLSKEQASAEFISKIEGCIQATKMPQNPTNLLEEIICDADLYDLGTDHFKNNNKKVRKEVEILLNKELSGSEWRTFSLIFLKKQTYKTDYCKKILQPGLEKNIQAIVEKQAEKDMEDSKKETGKEDKDKNKDKEKVNRGVETMFRTTSTNHLRLSEMADNKANIMITVNSIIISVLLTVLFRKLDTDPRFLIPTMLLLFTSLTTIVFSIFVTRPNVTSGVFSKEDIEKKRANLLFFGNFYKMKLEDYEWGIKQVMNDNDFLYGSMTRDIYHLGVVLGKKYKMLRIAYSFFMFGFIISVLSFVFVVIPL